MSDPCQPCVALDCDFPSDLDLYSLDGLNFFTGTPLYFVFNCPPEYDCSIKPVPWDLRITCCGKTLVGNVPGGASMLQINAIFQAMVQECAILESGCPVPTRGWEIRIRCCNTWLVGNVPAGATFAQIQNVITNLQTQYAQIYASCNEIVPEDPTRRFNPKTAFRFEPMQPRACKGVDTALTFAVKSSFSPLTFAVIGGSLPPGLSLVQISAKGAQLQGTPTTMGTYTFTIQAAYGTFAGQHQYTVTVWGISNANTLPDATANTLYVATLTGAGGTAPYSFLPDLDTFPPWLTLAPDGTLGGTPDGTDIGTTFDFNVTVTDSEEYFCIVPCSIRVVVGCTADTGTPFPVVLPSSLPGSLYISNWATDKLLLVAPAADPAGPQPEWDGTLPVMDTTLFPGTAFWFPAGTAPPVFMALSFNGILGDTGGIYILLTATGWQLAFSCLVGGVSTVLWNGLKLVGDSPVGTYMRDPAIPGISTGPDCFHVLSICQQDTGGPVPATFLAAIALGQPARVRIKNFNAVVSAVLPAVDGCASCNNKTTEPAWDGTFPNQNAGPFNLEWNSSANCGVFPIPPFSMGTKVIQGISPAHTCFFSVALLPGVCWFMTFGCDENGQPPEPANGTIWYGIKTVGDNAMGTYVRDPGTTQLSSVPDCIEIEQY